MMRIVNLTQHAATPDQIAAGVFDLPTTEQAQLRALLTFETYPETEMVADRALKILKIGADHGVVCAMIGGAPWLMGSLTKKLRTAGITPFFAFSVRETAEQPQPDGSVRKVAVFRHAGFVPAL
jgi:hypothetical protein